MAQALALAAATVSMLAVLPMLVLTGYTLSLAFRAKRKADPDKDSRDE